MKVEKFPVITGRTRCIPKGFGWVDHRLIQDGHLRECSTDASALYLVLVTVADQDGLSYYGESLLCAMLGWSRIRLEKALAKGNGVIALSAHLGNFFLVPMRPFLLSSLYFTPYLFNFTDKNLMTLSSLLIANSSFGMIAPVTVVNSVQK